MRMTRFLRPTPSPVTCPSARARSRSSLLLRNRTANLSTYLMRRPGRRIGRLFTILGLVTRRSPEQQSLLLSHFPSVGVHAAILVLGRREMAGARSLKCKNLEPVSVAVVPVTKRSSFSRIQRGVDQRACPPAKSWANTFPRCPAAACSARG